MAIQASSIRLPHWVGPSPGLPVGARVQDLPSAFVAFELVGAPDFSSSRFPDYKELSEAERIASVGAVQEQALAALHALGPNVGLALRYVVAGSQSSPRLRVILTVRVSANSERDAFARAQEVKNTFLNGFPAGYRWTEILEDGHDALSRSASIVEILAPEELLPVQFDPEVVGLDAYYIPHPFRPAPHDMRELARALLGSGIDDAALEVILVPTSPLSVGETEEIEANQRLCEKWGREQKLDVLGGLYMEDVKVELAPDPSAIKAKRLLEDASKRLTQINRFFLYSVRLHSPSSTPQTSLAATMAASCLAPGVAYQTVPLDRNHPHFERARAASAGIYVSPSIANEAIWNRPGARQAVRRLHRLASVGEAATFFRLPISGSTGCPGIALDAGIAVRKMDGGGVHIGNVVENDCPTQQQASFNLTDLSKHALVVGMPGSGKTTLCFSLLTQLWKDHGVPFLVIEPAKTEYRTLALVPGLEGISIFTPGNEMLAPFRLNPLEIPPGVALTAHISAVVASFQGAFNMPDPAPRLLEQAVQECYFEFGFSEYELGGERPDAPYPRLSDLHRTAVRLISQSSYKGEALGIIKGVLDTRLGTLLRGAKGRCFNTSKSLPIERLLAQPTVLELEGLNDDEKALFIMFLLNSLRGYVRANRKSGNGLDHVLLLEEAHNLIGRETGGERDGPMATATKFFVRMLAEMRALREGIVIADQLPTAIAPEAVKNTNIKVMHRMVSLADREELGSAMLMTESQTQRAAILQAGESFVFMEGWAQSRAVLEPDFKMEYGVVESLSDRECRDLMVPQVQAMPDVYLPYSGCKESCSACDARLRESMERWADATMRKVAEERKANPSANPLALAGLEFAELPLDNPVRINCATQHMKEIVIPSAKEVGK